MNQRTAFITGVNGAIGQALCITFGAAGWRVVGSDKQGSSDSQVEDYIAIDLARLCRDTAYCASKMACLEAQLSDAGLHVLINNAATQIVAPVEELTVNDWHTSMDVNLISPFLLSQALLSKLHMAKGSIINIASIHARLTKPHFAVYATSKAALVSLTRSLAVELGNRIRVNAICPAAIATPMLVQGFKYNPHGLAELAAFHPSECIGTTKDVADSALFLAQSQGRFLNGAVLELDGGISGSLHDPVPCFS